MVTAMDQFAQLISTAPREHDSQAIGRSRAAFIDTLACMFVGSSRPVAQKALAAVKHWGQGELPTVGQAVKLKPLLARACKSSLNALNRLRQSRNAMICGHCSIVSNSRTIWPLGWGYNPC